MRCVSKLFFFPISYKMRSLYVHLKFESLSHLFHSLFHCTEEKKMTSLYGKLMTHQLEIPLRLKAHFILTVNDSETYK